MNFKLCSFAVTAFLLLAACSSVPSTISEPRAAELKTPVPEAADFTDSVEPPEPSLSNFQPLATDKVSPPSESTLEAKRIDIRPVQLTEFFGAPPEAIAQLLGPALDSTKEADSETVTYNPDSFAPSFPDASFKSLSVNFENAQAQSIHLVLDTPVPGFIGIGGILEDDESTALDLHTTLFQSLFQDPAPTYTLLDETHPGMSLQVRNYCVAEGIATSLIDGQLYDLNFYREPSCLGQ